MENKLYIIPSAISAEAVHVLPEEAIRKIASLRIFIVENDKTARRFLKSLIPDFSLALCQFFVLNEHTSVQDTESFLDKIHEDFGLMSEAGCPCVADPGANIVRLAHQKNVEVVPLIGPSSILLALMASGLPGQNFVFHGYLPKEKNQRLKKLRNLESASERETQTQIFMETPYHGQNLFTEIVNHCQMKTWVCVACDLTSLQQFVKTLTVEEWRKMPAPNLEKRPTVFLLCKDDTRNNFRR